MNCYERIVAAMAEEACKSVCRKTVRQLQGYRDVLLSGDASGLANAWDEICVQVQEEESFYWDAYESTICSLLRPEIESRPDTVLAAIWLQTQDGEEWAFSKERHEPAPFDVDAIVEHVLRRHILPAAMEHTNERIRYYLDPYS